MRAYIPEFSLQTPKALSEALALIERDPELRPIAGGTDLMVLLEAGKLPFKKLVSLWALHELRGIRVAADHIELGALTTYAEIREHAQLQKEYPLLLDAARQTGAVAIQNRGTIGGNIANASPAADSPPALLVYDASVVVRSSQQERVIPYSEFHLDYKKTQMKPSELLVAVRLPRVSGTGWRDFYRKVGTRGAQAISKVCLAARLRTKADGTIEEIRLAFGAVAATVKRVPKVEQLVKGHRIDSALIAAARAELAREIKPVSDIRSEADYRLEVAQNLLEEFLGG